MFFHTYLLFPYSINSLDVDNISPINAVNPAVSIDGIPAMADPAYGVTKYIPVLPNTLAIGLKPMLYYTAPTFLAVCNVLPACDH